jgi:hypothetical protein
MNTFDNLDQQHENLSQNMNTFDNLDQQHENLSQNMNTFDNLDQQHENLSQNMNTFDNLDEQDNSKLNAEFIILSTISPLVRLRCMFLHSNFQLM